MDNLSTYYLTQGVLGVSVLVLSYVVVHLYKENKELQTQKTEILEARRIDDRATLKEVTTILNDNAQNMRILSEKIEVSKTSQRQA